MAITSFENILKVLSSFNPWWRTGSVRPEFNKTYKRFAYHEAVKVMEHPDIRRSVILTGTRRVGKTTIQYQLIQRLLSEHIEPQRILFVSLDHPLLKLSSIDEILACYKENIYSGNDGYFFFDEVQYATDWDKWVKTIYDTEPLTHIIATGSASPVLNKKATESGAGRWTVIPVPTLSFFEYCELLQISELPKLDSDVRPTGLVKYSKQQFNSLFVKLSPLQKHFNRYLQIGGFPELALSSDDVLAQNIIREDIVDKVLKRDIPSLYNIRNATALERIFLYLCYCSSNIIAIDAISKELEGVSRATVEDYISYMESANLIYRSYPVDMSGKRVLKAKAKIYIADAAIRNAVLMDENFFMDPKELGVTVETSVYKHLASFYYQSTTGVGYYRGGKKDKEIDVVVDYPTGKILVEVKYRDTVQIGEKDAIYELADEASCSIIVTKRDSDYGLQKSSGEKKILRIPAFAFLYLLGNAEKNGYKGRKN